MLKVGIVGMGGISQSHRKAWLQMPDVKLAAVCDVRPEKVEEAAAETGAKAYTDFDAMLAAEKLDILDICLPTFLHAEHAIKALNAGIHVVTEKPVSLERDDVARIYEAARANDRRFMVAQVLRFWREYVALKEAIDTGKYGRLLSGSMSRLGNTPKWSWENWMRDGNRSGLVPYDLHIHDLDFLIYALGKPVSTVCHRARGEGQDYFSCVYEYPGCFVNAEAAWYNCDYPFQASYRFQFEKALMEFKGGKLTIRLAGGGEETLPEEAAIGDNGINLPSTNAYFNELRYFTDCVLAGVPCDRVRQEELEAVLDIIAIINRC